MNFAKYFTKYEIVYGSVQSITPTAIYCFDSSNNKVAILTFYPDSDEVPQDTIFIGTTPIQNFLNINFHRKELPGVYEVFLNERPLLVSANYENFGAIGFFPASESFFASKFEPIGEQEP